MTNGKCSKILSSAFLACILWSGNILSEPTRDNASKILSHLPAVTVEDPEIPLDELKVKLKPLTQEDLFAEANAWFELLKSNIHELSTAKLQVGFTGSETKS